MRLTLLHAYYQLLEVFRQPTYLVTTILFPSMFFWFFGVPNAKESSSAQMLMGSFSCFAILGVVLFQFAVGTAQERASAWSSTLRVLPIRSWQLLAAKFLVGLVVALITFAGVVATALVFTDLQLASDRWGSFILAVLLGGFPFAALGLLIGYSCTAKSALPVANLVYLPLSFAGGLWLPPNALPEVVQDISELLPTRFYGELVWATLFGTEVQSRHLVGLSLYFLVFILVTLWLYRKREGEQFG